MQLQMYTKSELTALEKSSRSDDPSDALETVEAIMDEITAQQIKSGDLMIRHFVTYTLQRIVVGLLKRSEVDDEVECRIFNFLEATLRFIAKTLDSGLDNLLVILHDIFCEQNNFYTSCTGAGACEDIADLTDGMGIEIYDDSTLWQDAPPIFADPAGPTNPECNNRATNLGKFCSNINTFGRCGGFRELKSELERKNPPPSLLRVKLIVAPVHEIREFLVNDFLVWFTSANEQVFELLMSMSDEDLKSDYKVASDAISFASTLYRYTDRGDGCQLADERRLDFALKGFRSQFLERRLASLNDINEILESLDSKDAVRDDDYGPFWVSKEYMCGWLERSSILEMIFTRNLHLEVLKRSYRIMTFLASNNRISVEHVEMIWDVATGKHETIQKNIYDLLLHITRFLIPDTLKTMVDLIRALPHSSYTQQHIDMLRLISGFLVTWGSKKKLDFQYLGPEVLWELIQDDVRFSQPELHIFALQVLVEVLDMHDCRCIRGDYFTKCVSNLTRHRSVPQSLGVMNKLLNSMASKRKKPEADCITYDCVRDDQELLELVIDDLVIYQKKACTQLQAQPVAERQVLSAIFDGLYTHQDQIDRRLMFIGNLLERADVTLTFELAGVLWNSLVCSALSKGLQDFAMRWFEQMFSSSWTREAVGECAEKFFLELVCRQPVPNFSETGFSLFRSVMRLVNWKRKWLGETPAANHTTQIIILNFELVGMSCLWNIAVLASNEVVAGQAISMLNELYQNLGPTLHDRVREKREEYVKNCMHYMLQGAKELESGDAGTNRAQEVRVCRCIRLLKTMLADFESKVTAGGSGVSIRKHGLRLRGEQVSLRLLRFAPGVSEAGSRDLLRVTVFSNSTLSLLRKEIAKVLGEDTCRLRLFAGGRELKDDFKTISELKLADGDAVHWTSRQVEASAERDEMEVSADAKSDPKSGSQSSENFNSANDEEMKVPHYVVSRIYFDEIFKMLDTAPQFITSQLWELLMTLPTNARILNEIRNLGSSWRQSLCSQSVYGLLYSLQVVECLLDDSAVNGGQWSQTFTDSGGLDELLDVILSPRFESPDSVQSSECLALLLKLITLLTVSKYSSSKEDMDKSEAKCEGVPLLASCLDRGKGFQVFVHRLMCILSDSSRILPQKQNTVSLLDIGREKVGTFAIELLTACAIESGTGLKYLYSFPTCDKWISQVLLHNGSTSLRQELAKCFLRIAQGVEAEDGDGSVKNQGSVKKQHPRIFFLDLLLPLIQDLAQNNAAYDSASYRCTELFNLTNELLRLPGELIDESSNGSHPNMLGSRLEDVALSLANSLKQSAIVEERNGSRDDQILIGILRTLQSLVLLRPELRKLLGSASGLGLVKHIFINCLFSVPSVESHEVDGPPKCKLPRSRVAAFDLLLRFVDDCVETYSELLDLLLAQCSRRELRQLHFYQPSQMDKAPCGYVGLRNLGATCYMNSLLQQLFLIPELRAAILQVPIVEEDKSNSLMYQLQALFGFLQESERQYYETRDLCHAYRDYDGQPVNTSQQMDVDEYFNMLFDKLEKCLKGTQQERILQDCFGGKVVNQIICKETVRVGDQVFGLDNPFKSEREEKFFTLQLEVKHKRNILESLDLFVEGEMLEGDNKYFCEEADQRVDAMKRVCIKELPRTLILHLKRFEFDLDFMKKVKVNDCCEFPTRLNMYPYTLAGIEEREKAVTEAARSGQDPASVLDQLQNPSDCEYELVGVLVHTGTADSGHYYSYIKERVARDDSESGSKKEGSWFLFNDTHVELFDDKEIGAACYGGSEYVQQLDAGQQRPKCVPRSYNAYMLFYERISTAASVDRVKVGLNSKIRVPLPDEIMKGVWTENLQFLQDKQHYDATYFSFIFNFCSLGASVHGVGPVDPVKAESRKQGAVARRQMADEGFRIMQLAVFFVMNTLIHSWDTSQMESWVALIKSLLTPDRKNSLEWALDSFCDDVQEGDMYISCHWLREALLHCRVLDARSQMLSLFLHIIRQLGPLERGKGRGAEKGADQIPYCTGLLGGKRSLEPVRPEAVGQHPLLTDFPYQRLSKGGWDPSLEMPDSYLPFPRPCTHVGKFLDQMLSLLPDLPQHWRHFGEYFKLLAAISDIGKEERQFLLSRRAISRCIDLFLNEESPFSSHRKHAIRMGDKFSSPMFAPMLDFVSSLVRSTALEQMSDDEMDDSASPATQLPIVGELDTACYRMVTLRCFLCKALLEGGNYPAVQALFVHLSWFSEDHSKDVIQVVCEAIEEECHDDELQAHLDLLAMIIAIPDGLQSFRIDKFVFLFVHAVSEVAPYPDIFKRCVEFMCDLVAHRPEVRNCVRHWIFPGSKRRDNARWLESWMIKLDNEICRNAAHTLACVLAFPAAFVRRAAPPTLPPGVSREEAPSAGPERSEPEPDALLDGDDCSQIIFDVLLAALPVYAPLAQAADQCRPASVSSRLVLLFRALTFIVKTAAGQWCLDRLFQSMQDLSTVLASFNEFRAEIDYNRAELYKLLLVAIQRSRNEVLEQITTDARWVDALIRNPLCSVQAKAQKANINYNRLHLPTFFRLMKECCVHSADFTESYFGSCHCTYSLTNVLCLHGRHTDSAIFLLETVDVALEWEKQGRISSLDHLRRFYLDALLRKRQLFAAPEHSIPFVEKLLFHSTEPKDIVEEISMLVESNHLEIFVTSARSVSDGPRTIDQARQASIRILDQMFESAKLVEKKIPDLQIESKVRNAMQNTECTGLVLFLIKCLLHHALPSSLRQHYLGVLINLCRCDDEAMVACISEVIRIYDSTALESTEDVVAAREARNLSKKPMVQAQSLSKRSRGKSKSETVKKGSTPSVARAGESDCKDAPWVSEIWHAFRGPKGSEDCDDVFFDLVLELCRLSWQAVLRARDSTLAARTQKLCICAAIDSVQGSRSRLLELLTFLINIGVAPDDSSELEGAGRPQQSAGADGGDGGSGGDDDVQWARALVRTELLRLGHAEALAVRLLLCYKELLTDTCVERALVGLLTAAAPGWPSRQQSLVVNTRAADVVAAADAAVSSSQAASGGVGGVRSRSGARSSAATRDTAVLDAVLRELRPLALATRVPALMRIAVGTDADRDCPAAVRRAIEAAGVNRGNAETEQRCEEADRLMAAIADSARALRDA